jgi:hypothetical protein
MLLSDYLAKGYVTVGVDGKEEVAAVPRVSLITNSLSEVE